MRKMASARKKPTIRSQSFSTVSAPIISAVSTASTSGCGAIGRSSGDKERGTAGVFGVSNAQILSETADKGMRTVIDAENYKPNSDHFIDRLKQEGRPTFITSNRRSSFTNDVDLVSVDKWNVGLNNMSLSHLEEVTPASLGKNFNIRCQRDDFQTQPENTDTIQYYHQSNGADLEDTKFEMVHNLTSLLRKTMTSNFSQAGMCTLTDESALADQTREPFKKQKLNGRLIHRIASMSSKKPKIIAGQQLRMAHRRLDQRELRATIRMAIVISLFCGMWIGFFVIYVVHGWCSYDCDIPRQLEAFFFWLGYSNSSINPILYTLFNDDFRKAFSRILCGRRCPRMSGH